MSIDDLRCQAENYRAMYRCGGCTREEARFYIQPYLDLANKKSKELAKKYNQKPKLIQFCEYVR